MLQKKLQMNALKESAMETHANEGSAFPVDFVYCWAGEALQFDSGSDGANGDVGEIKASGATHDHNVGSGFGELRYSIRYLEANAPWFNRVFILTDSPAKRPAWLTEASNDRVVMIDRCGLFPRAQDCPTKNSHACTSVMHKIPSLSEHFVAMDDDFLLLHPLAVSDFFNSSGQPLVLTKNADDEASDVYGGIAMTLGPDTPPIHRPSRMKDFDHLPVPLTLSFASQMESNYSEWYAYVRSHRTRFICCNASKLGNGLDESFTRIYPHMLLKWKVGIKHEIPGHATCVGQGGWTDYGHDWTEPCFLNMIRGLPRDADTSKDGPKHMYMTLQNIQSLGTWASVRTAMDAELAHVQVSQLVAEPAH